MPRGRSAVDPRVQLADRLRERRAEIEEALLTRTYAIADPKEAADPEYAQGLRAAVSVALDYGLAAVEHGEERAPQVPILLLAQARLAARNDVPLDTVLRRYFAGYTLLVDFIVSESGTAGLKESGLKHLLRDQAATFDRFLATVSEEHAREEGTRWGSTEERRAERIERLLAGELVDVSDLGYDFDGWHLGVVAFGDGVEQVVRDLATRLDCRLLLLGREERTIWAWFGARRRLEPADLLRMSLAKPRDNGVIAIGEPGEGLSGWRLTHRQADAALSVAARYPPHVVGYSDIALLTTVIRDDLLADFLRRRYLAPLEADRDGGELARETLYAYFAAERNISSAAAAVGVSRQAVRGRLRTIEERIGCSLNKRALEVELVLRLHKLEAMPNRKARL